MAKLVNEVEIKYKSTDRGVTKAPKALQKALKDSAKAIGTFDEAVKGTIKTVKMQDEAFTIVTGKIKKLSDKNENLSVTAVKVTENLKAQRRAAENLGRAQDKLIAKTQRTIAQERASQAVRQKTLAQMSMMSELSRARRLGREDFNNQIRLENEKAKAIERAAIATRKAQKTTKQFASVTQSAVQKAILSWKSFERVMLVHIIRRVFHMLMTTIRQAITRIQEFHTAIVEIRTISQTMPAAVDAWADSLVRVSNAWSIDLIDAANARYQILSNQIAKGVVQTELFSAAAFKFAKVTKATAEESVNLLTASLNAYGKTAEEVTRVSAILFKLIEFGRVRVSDIANSFGRASVPAAQLGISLEELAATIAAITIKGVKGTEAMTLIRGIVMKLNKPTKELTTIFDKYGVSSGEAFISTFRLSGALKILQEETKGSSTAIAELFGRIRPTMGISALLSDLDGFNDVLVEFGDKAVLDYMDALNDQFQTSGEKIKRAFNEIKNFIQIGVGKSATAALLGMTDKLKSFEIGIDGTRREISGLVNAVKILARVGIAAGIVFGSKLLLVKLIPVIISATIALDAFIFSIRLGIIAGNALSVTFGGLAIGLAAIAPLAIVLGAMFAVDKMIRWRNEIKSTRRELDDMLASLVKTQNNNFAIADLKAKISPNVQQFNRQTQGAREGLTAGLTGVFGKLPTGDAATDTIKALEEQQKLALTSFKEHAKAVANTLKGLYKSLRDEIAEANKAIVESADRIDKIGRTIEDKIFSALQRGKTSRQQLAALRGRQTQLLGEFRGVSDKDIDAKRIAYDRAVTAIGEYFNALHSQATAVQKASAAEEDAFNKQEARRKKARLRGAKGFAGEPLSGYIIPVKAGAGSIDTHRKIALKHAAALKAVGIAGKEAENAFQAHQDSLKEIAKQSIKDLDAILKEITDKAEGIGGAVAKVIANAFKGLDPGKAKTGLTELLDELKETGLLPAGSFLALNDAQTAFNDINTQTENTRAGLEKWGTHLSDVKTTMEGILNLEREYEKQRRLINKDISLATAVQLDAAKKVQVAINALATDTDKQATLGTKGFAVNEADIALLREYTKVLSDAKLPVEDHTIAMGRMQEVIRRISKESIAHESNILGKKTSLFGLLLGIDPKESKGFVVITDALRGLQGALSEIQGAVRDKTTSKHQVTILKMTVADLGDIKTKAEAAGAALIKAGQAGIDNYIEFNRQLKISADLLVFIQSKTGGVEASLGNVRMPFAQGGSIHAAMGQFISRGTDTVPAMLTPGEFVMNRSATAKFMQQLVPMNFGQQNANHTQQGNNVQFGDINVTVDGGHTPRQTAVDIGNALRRELRRGRVAL